MHVKVSRLEKVLRENEHEDTVKKWKRRYVQFLRSRMEASRESEHEDTVKK